MGWIAGASMIENGLICRYFQLERGLFAGTGRLEHDLVCGYLQAGTWAGLGLPTD